MLPPRPPRAGSPSASSSSNPSGTISSAWSLAAQVERDASKHAETAGVKRSLFSWSAEDFERKYNLNKVENIRLSPSVGRMAYVNSQSDPAVAIRRVNGTAFANGLPKMAMQQKSHERKALRRKRKLREAWRQRFRIGFKAAVNRAMELRRQGW